MKHVGHIGLLTHSKNSYLNQRRSSIRNKSLAINSASNCDEAASAVLPDLKDLQIDKNKYIKISFIVTEDKSADCITFVDPLSSTSSRFLIVQWARLVWPSFANSDPRNTLRHGSVQRFYRRMLFVPWRSCRCHQL